MAVIYGICIGMVIGSLLSILQVLNKISNQLHEIQNSKKNNEK